jgi:transposase
MRHDRVSVISGLSLSPQRRHVGLYYRLHDKNIQQAEICDFLRYLLRHLRGPVIVVWDNLRQHGGPPIHEFCARFPRLHLERFPPYAPELNPDEGVWTHAKAHLANGRPDDLTHLRRHVRVSLRSLQRSQPKLKACIRHADLPLFLP